MTTHHDNDEELAAAAALNALEAAVAADAAERRTTDPDFDALVRTHEDTVVALAESVEPVEPPASMRAHLLAMIAETPQRPAPDAEATPTAAPAPESAPAEPALPEATAPRRARTPRVASGRRYLIGTLAVFAAAAIFVGGLVLGQVRSAPEATLGGTVATLLASADLERRSEPVAGGGAATVVWSPTTGQAAIAVDGLPALDAQRVYELWFIDGTGPASAGTFTATGANGADWVLLDGTMKAGDVIAVTVEPANGTGTPTTDPILVVES